MILTDFTRALGQIGDARFRRVLLLGVLLSVALLAAISVGFLWLLQLALPETMQIPFLGPVGGIDTVLGWGLALLLIPLSVFLMVPVASAFTGFFLESVAEAVETRHYPHLAAPRQVPLAETVTESLSFFAVLIVANIGALLLYPFAGPLVPLIFWMVNGYLLGREYFTLVAARRLGRTEARAMRKHHAVQVWLAGVLMAIPLSVPLVNLLVPVLGAATFTHLFHRLNGSRSAR